MWDDSIQDNEHEDPINSWEENEQGESLAGLTIHESLAEALGSSEEDAAADAFFREMDSTKTPNQQFRSGIRWGDTPIRQTLDGLRGEHKEDILNYLGGKASDRTIDNWLGSYGERGTGPLDEQLAYKISQGEADLNHPTHLMGGATIATLQLGRIEGVDPKIAAGIKAVLNEQPVEGIGRIDAMAARESFAEMTGMEPSQFANLINIDGFNAAEVPLPRSNQDLRTVVSMLQNTAGEYIDKGPGGKLENHHQNFTKQEKADKEMYDSIATVKRLANRYIHPNTIGTKVEGARREALESSITGRLRDGKWGFNTSNILALPNETGVLGIKRTQGIWKGVTNQGTAEDRLSASKYNDLYETFMDGQKTKFIRNKKGHKVFKKGVTEEQRKAVLRGTPSLYNSIYNVPLTKAEKKSLSASEMEGMAEDNKMKMKLDIKAAHKASAVFKSQLSTVSLTGEQSDTENIRNLAAEQDKDWGAAVDSETRVTKKVLVSAEAHNARERKAYQERLEFGPTNVGPNIYQSGLMQETVDVGGSERGGFYGNSIMSEQQIFVEKAREEEEEKKIDTSGDIKQGTDAWLRLREGKITASAAAGLLAVDGIEERALALAEERLGEKKKFEGNSDTREGNEGEAKAVKAFMAKHGRGLTFKEAFFETNPNHEGFGVSPDGRMYHGTSSDEENFVGPRQSAGLLEVKFLGSGGMDEAIKTYTPQVQMQMAIAGEKETHFYALDKQTDEYVYKLIEADPAMQAELLAAGEAALDMSEDLDYRGVQALRNNITNRKAERKIAREEARIKKAADKVKAKADKAKSKSNVDAKNGVHSKAFSEDTDDKEVPMTPFDDSDSESDQLEMFSVSGEPEQMDFFGKDLPSEDVVSDTVITERKKLNHATRVDRADRTNRLNDMSDAQLRSLKADTLPISDIEIKKPVTGEDQASAKNAFNNTNDRPAFGDAEDNDASKNMSDYYAKAQKDSAKATKDATKSMQEFSKELRSAAGVLGELGGIVVSGNTSAMDEIRMAAQTGQSVEELRGTRRALTKGGLSKAGAEGVLTSAARQALTLNNERDTEKEVRRLHEEQSLSNRTAVLTMNLPSAVEFQGMKSNQIAHYWATQMVGMSPEDKAYVANTLARMPDLAAFDGDPMSLLTENHSINKEGARDAYTGINLIDNLIQDGKESVGSMGFTAGLLGAGGVAIGGIANSLTGGLLAPKIPAAVSKAGAFLSKAKTVGPATANMVKNATNATVNVTANAASKTANAAMKNSNKAVTAIKGLGVGAKVTPVALATSLAPMAIRHYGEVEDDGGLADSALDVMEFASYGASGGAAIGAAIGAFGFGVGAVPGAMIGSAIGGVGGAAVGVANEAWEWLTDDDDVVPSSDIGYMPSQTSQQGASNPIVNVEVTNEISPDLIKTTTNVNGDLNIDEEATSSAGYK